MRTFQIQQMFDNLPVSQKMQIIELLLENTKENNVKTKRPVFGCAKGKFKIAEDFNAPIEDFIDYM